jgi:hypothetical protein
MNHYPGAGFLVSILTLLKGFLTLLKGFPTGQRSEFAVFQMAVSKAISDLLHPHYVFIFETLFTL